MTPIKDCRYSALLLRPGWPAMVQAFVYFDGTNFRNEDTKAIEHPYSFEPRTNEDVARHEFADRWSKAWKAGA